MFTAPLETIHTQSPTPWRSAEYFAEPAPERSASHSLLILQDRDLEENGPSLVFHG